MPKKKTALTIEERLQQALVPAEEQPYEVPENWVWVRLGDVNKYISKSVNPISEPDKIFELYSVPSMVDNYPEIIAGSDIGSSKQSVCKKDVLLCKINPRINRVWKVSQFTDNELIASSEWIIIRNNHIDANYLMYCFQSKYFREFMLSNVSGVGGSLMRAQPKYVQTYPVPLPPLSEQQRIVERIEELFAKLDEAKERLQEVADSFAVRKAAILHKAFTGELTQQWRCENGVSDESWEEKKLSEITENQDSKRIPLSKSQRDNMNRIYDYYGASGIIDKVDDYIFEGKKLLIGEDGANLVTRSKDIAFIADGKYWVNNHAHILDVKDTVLLMYLCHYINNMDLIPYVTGSAQPKLTQAKMNNIKIFLPTLSEQHEIVRLIDDLLARECAAQQAAEQALASIELMKKSILARAFRGELGTNKASEASALELLRQVLAEN